MEKVKLIPLYADRGFVIVDEDDFYKLIPHRWVLTLGYPKRHLGGTKYEYMHHAILPCPVGLLVDHINRDPLDNRRSNLRLATKAQNAMNAGMWRHNNSGHKGVCRWKNGKWRAYIMVNQKSIWLGVHQNIEDAIRARKDGEMKYFGEFAARE